MDSKGLLKLGVTQFDISHCERMEVDRRSSVLRNVDFMA
jgi:hypothetical protein